MNENEKKQYLESYDKAKKEGVPFFPDTLVKDAVIALVVFIILAGLSLFLGAPLEARANPNDTSYIPRPEWYFLFLYQLLKYFPGNLEVVGVVIIPMLVLVLLFLLPLLDKSPRRYFTKRPIVIGVTLLAVVGIIGLTFLSLAEKSPLADATAGNNIANVYLKNCSACHGDSIKVTPGTNLHEVIAQGTHEGMPAWNADLTSDQIDALAGFILRPEGNKLFITYCGTCHETAENVVGEPIEIKKVLEMGTEYPGHVDQNVPQFIEVMSKEEQTTLLNFLVAPDGQRLYAINCSSCHGNQIDITSSEAELRATIEQGGKHLEMPAWGDQLIQSEMETLASYVVNPTQNPDGKDLYEKNCTKCHQGRLPNTSDYEQALKIISSGGVHETMPVWGDFLTLEQIDALASYILEASQGASTELGQQLFAQDCASCHGDFGEGGPNPAKTGDIIPPISTAEYLKTRDDATLQSILAQGQPSFGMSPFGLAFGGPLDDDQINAIVAFIRSWEKNPPVELPPEVTTDVVSLSGQQLYDEICAQCHDTDGAGITAPPMNSSNFKSTTTDQAIFDAISKGHQPSGMIAWGDILTSTQIMELVDLIKSFPIKGEKTTETPTTTISFASDVMPVLEANCNFCHGQAGEWNGSSYTQVINSGENAPVVIPGDSEKSLLIQKLLGTQKEGDIMPPSGKMAEENINIIIKWVDAGALDN